MLQKAKGRLEWYVNLLHVRSFALDKQAGPLWQRHGYREGKEGIVDPSLQEDFAEQVAEPPIPKRQQPSSLSS